jgi:DNA-nicking Smr family endonuclease
MKSSGSFQPFRQLKKMLQSRIISVEELPAQRITLTDEDGQGDDLDQRLFEKAMADVTPLKDRGQIPPENLSPRPIFPSVIDYDGSLAALRELVHSGRGFRVADTPEYIEGTGYQVPAGIARQLHRGFFAIQAHIDLHGMTVAVAREAVDTFLRDAIERGYGAVLIVHGRGLSSPAEPVLKTKVVQWLTSGPWRKWTMAYASARLCDGGAGATYVLLRATPQAKHRRR